LGNATASGLIIGLAVGAIGLLAIAGHRSLAALQAAILPAGAWMIISPVTLESKIAITASMH